MSGEKGFVVTVRWRAPFKGSDNEEMVKLAQDATLGDLYTKARGLTRSGSISLWLGHPAKYDLGQYEPTLRADSILKNLSTVTLRREAVKNDDGSGASENKIETRSHEHKAETNFVDLLESSDEKASNRITCSPLRGDKQDAVDLFVLGSFLSPSECKAFVEQSEKIGYEPLRGYNQEYRSNHRMVALDGKLAAKLYERIEKFLPGTITHQKKIWRRIGLNECFRFCRYTAGQKFRKHCDALYARSEKECSFFTVNIYLNGYSDFEGGCTRFYLSEDSGKVTESMAPTPGSACVFNHATRDFLHDGQTVKSGIKYLLRTDVMYRRVDDDK